MDGWSQSSSENDTGTEVRNMEKKLLTAKEVAQKWRKERDYEDGVVIIHDNVVQGWVEKLCDPDHWQPGCVAVDEAGVVFIAAGGNSRDGAQKWEKQTGLSLSDHKGSGLGSGPTGAGPNFGPKV